MSGGVRVDERSITMDEAQAALEKWVRQAIRGHAGDVTVVAVSEEGDVEVEFSGACRACPLQPVTFGCAVVPALQVIPGVRSVNCDSVRVSAHALRRMSELMRTVSPQ